MAHVQSNSYGEVQETDVMYNPSYTGSAAATTDNGGLIPIAVDNYIRGWKQTKDDIPVDSSGNQEQPQHPDYAQVSCSKSLRTWTYTMSMSEAAAVALDKASLAFNQAVNSVTFQGLTTGPAAQNLSCPPGTVKVDSITTDIDPFESRAVVQVVCIYREAGWNPWVAYRDFLLLGGAVPANTWRAGTDSNGSYDANGVIQATVYNQMDINALISMMTGQAPSPFPTGS